MFDPAPVSAPTSVCRWRLATAAFLAMVLALPAARSAAAQSGAAAGRDRAGAEITVAVSHPAGDGDVACALFATPEGFPDAAAKSRGVVHPSRGTSATCTFDGVAPGTYAVSVLLDTNRNGKADRNFLGMPSEPWGVSNGARPRMRAPNFEEASFTVEAGATLTIPVELK